MNRSSETVTQRQATLLLNSPGAKDANEQGHTGSTLVAMMPTRLPLKTYYRIQPTGQRYEDIGRHWYRHHKVRSTKPEDDELLGSDQVLTARAESIRAAKALPPEAWKLAWMLEGLLDKDPDSNGSV